MPEISTKPYLLRALYEWCTDNGHTPYLAAIVNNRAQVPMQFVKNGEIVLNISFQATSGLKIDNDVIHFTARFGGVAREIVVPVDNVIAIYARENGQGMAFEVSAKQTDHEDGDKSDSATNEATVAGRPQSASAGLTAVPSPVSNESAEAVDATENHPPRDNNDPPKKGGRPTLTRIK